MASMKCGDIYAARSTSFSLRKMFIMAGPAAARGVRAVGVAVEELDALRQPGVGDGVVDVGRAIAAPSGCAPLVMAFAIVIRSGRDAKRLRGESLAPMQPSR